MKINETAKGKGTNLTRQVGYHFYNSKSAKFFVAAFFFTFSLESFGFKFAGYPISVPLFFLFLSVVMTLLYGKVRGLPFLFGLMFIIWAVYTNIDRHVLSSYILSVAALLLLGIPLVMRVPIFNPTIFMIKWFLYGGVLSFIFLYYDLCIIYLHFPTLSQLFPFVMPQAICPLPRVTASMPEPSFYATYLVFLYACTDFWIQNKGLKSKYIVLLKMHIFIGLVLTLSLSGLLLIGIYFLFKFLGNIVPKVNKMLRGRVLVILPEKSFVAMVVFTIILLFQLLNMNSIFSYIYGRVHSIPTAILNVDYSGSVGKRVNAINTALLYLRTGGILEITSGEGYANYEDWLEGQFSTSYSSVGIARTIQNIFAVIIISTGLVGFFLYIGFITVIFYSCKDRLGVSFLIIWLAYHFTTGHLIIYPLFGYLYLAATKGIVLKSVHKQIDQ